MQQTMTVKLDRADPEMLVDVWTQFQTAAEEYERLGAMVEAALNQRPTDRSTSARNHGAAARNTFANAGEVWTIVYAGRAIQLKDAKGLHDLRQLLLNPGVAIHVCDLVGLGGRTTGADPVLDDRAKAAYRARLAEVDRNVAAAQADNDLVRAEKAVLERDALIEELSRAVGLRDRCRRLGDETEKARKSVWARINHAIARIDRVHPALGEHLTDAISTGVYCCYEPADPVRWS